MMYEILLYPPKSPLKRGTLTDFPPFLRGARGDHLDAENHSQPLLKHPLTTSATILELIE
jgi:hypothetical protein